MKTSKGSRRSARPGPDDVEPVEPEVLHWHVTVTVGGEPMEPLMVRSALLRLSEDRPFLEALSFTSSSAQISFWDQGATMLDVASLALRLWAEHRETAALPRWEVLGLEIIEKHVRGEREAAQPLAFEKSTPLL